MSAPGKAPKFFDISDPDGPGLFAYRASTWLIDRIADEVRAHPQWRVGGGVVQVTATAHQPGKTLQLAAGEARLTITPEGSGWLSVVAELGGAEIFRGYVDQPTEDYAIWPGDVPGDGVAPGRGDKTRVRFALDASAWPGLGQGELVVERAG